MKTHALGTRLPLDLFQALDELCRRLGLRKNFVVESALREKIEDLLDAEDLRDAMREATGFHPWEKVKGGSGRGKRK